MGLRARHKLPSVIPTASTADIALLLIIYFMITIVYEKDRTRVQLPETSVRFELPALATYISLTRDGEIRIATGATVCGPESQDDLLDALPAFLRAEYPDRPVVLKADTAVPYGQVDRVLDAVKRAGVDTIYFQTRQKTVRSSP